jgi:acetyl/propionyl-CoA carboxylase alpha subunit
VSAPFRKVLIANRGEIAVRVIRACRELGIRTVAVFSEADRESLHVLLADEAVPIGPPPPGESYLVIDKLIAAARATRADAVHPGYGFLAENAKFAQACLDAKLIFIGPPPSAIRAMGDKMAARRVAIKMGVPVVPGTEQPVSDDAEAVRVAERVGYPVMLKAAMGGGGKGMRLVRTPGELTGALRAARSEAGAAFGDASVYANATPRSRATSRSRCWRRTRLRPWASAGAQSRRTRSWWRRARHRSSRPRCGAAWARPPAGWPPRSVMSTRAPSSSWWIASATSTSSR